MLALIVAVGGGISNGQIIVGSGSGPAEAASPSPGNSVAGYGDLLPTPPSATGKPFGLELTNVAGGWAQLNLRHATNEVYAIWQKTNLSAPWELALFCLANRHQFHASAFGNRRCQEPLRVGRGLDGRHAWSNQVPDAWLMRYFGTTNLSDTNRDQRGLTLLFDYQKDLPPMMGLLPSVVPAHPYRRPPPSIQFLLEGRPSLYVKTTNVGVQVQLLSGTPASYSVMADSWDFSKAVWRPYSTSNLAAAIGAADGRHILWVGLKSAATNDQPMWQSATFLKESAGPNLTATKPTNNILTDPMLEWEGCTDRELQSFQCEMSNSAGVMTNLMAFGTGNHYDANLGKVTMVYLACLDVPLAEGRNVLTARVIDRGGNVTISNYTYILDYSRKTNAPTLQIKGPTNGAALLGKTTPLNGWVSDLTAEVCAEKKGSGATSERYFARVGRDGFFFFDALPLAPGSNDFLITAKDILGHVVETNLSFTQMDGELSMDPAPPTQLWQPTVNLTGKVSNPNCEVWVNGVQATNHGDGTWSATGVPVNRSEGSTHFTLEMRPR